MNRESPGNGSRADEKGFECPTCGCRHHRVVRTAQNKHGIRRIRECRHCARRFGTWEKAS